MRLRASRRGTAILARVPSLPNPLRPWTLPAVLGAILLTDLSAQEAADATRAELAALREITRTFFDRTMSYEAAQRRQEREQLAVERTAAKAEFDAAIARYDAGHATPLVLDAAALRTVFRDVFRPAAPPPNLGEPTYHADDRTPYVELVPPGYDVATASPTVLLLADAEARATAEALQTFVTTTWGEPATQNRTIVIAPAAPPDLAFDAVEETPHPDATEGPRMAAAFAPLGAAMRRLHIDRDRIVLDCGRGTSAFGLRLASRFADRFAGIVLRWPVIEDGQRLEALSGLPVLLVRSPATAAACTALQARIAELGQGSCFVLTPPTEYPFAAERGIAEWVRQQRRAAMAPEVVLAPIDDRFHKNRWVQIETADPVDPAAPAKSPWLRATADLADNRITVESRGVKAFRLLLGPALVDVREFTLVVNGNRETVQLKPSLEHLVRQLHMRLDPAWLCTATHRVELR